MQESSFTGNKANAGSAGAMGLGGALGALSSCPNGICEPVSATLFNVSMAGNFAVQARLATAACVLTRALAHRHSSTRTAEWLAALLPAC